MTTTGRQPLAARTAALGLLALLLVSSACAQGDAKQGQYLVTAGGCIGCHTDTKEGAVPFAGGRALKTPFGTFFGPNITPDPQAGIGRWSESDFLRAMRHGERPDGANYFPAFPYPSFTKISDQDLRDIWAYLRTLPPSARASQEHDLGFFFRWRPLLTVWKRLFFTSGAFVPDTRATPEVNRGAYLTQALGHCGECHTPRNFLGGPILSRYLAGGKGPEGKTIPNLTPTRLKKQSDIELKDFLTLGTTADGDVPAEAMGEVIRNTTSKLLPADLKALISYLRSLVPIPSE